VRSQASSVAPLASVLRPRQRPSRTGPNSEQKARSTPSAGLLPAGELAENQ
jgi:hypothetical protein